jgi:hypothetical protein
LENAVEKINVFIYRRFHIILYLAIGSPDPKRIKSFQSCGAENVLISYAYVRELKNLKLPFKNILLDSGAFSVATGVEKISLKAYMLWLQLYLSQYPNINNYINLDDLDDPFKSIENFNIMRDEGLKPMPVYHYGEPEEILDYYASEAEYIGLGGIAVGRMPWQKLQLFWESIEKRYPKHKFHMLGVGTMNPFFYSQPYSIDSTSWNVGAQYGHLMCYRDGLPYRIADLNKYNGVELFFTQEELFLHNIRAQIDWGKCKWLDKVPPRSEQEKLKV